MRKLRIAAPQDFAGAIFLIVIGLGALWASSNLGMGTLRAMGPGMLPKSLGTIVAGLGAILLMFSLKIEGPKLDAWSIRGLFFVLLGTCLFALTIRGSDIDGIPERILSAALITVALLSLGYVSAKFTNNIPEKKENLYGVILVLIPTIFAAIFYFAPVINLSFPAIGLIAAGPLVAIVSAFASPETRWGEVIIFAAFMTALCAGIFKYALGLPIPLAPWLLGY